MRHLLYDSCKSLCFLCAKIWFRAKYVGKENLPRSGAVILLGNHCSHLDPPLMGCSLPRRVHYMAKSSLRRVPILGLLIANLGVLFVERSGGARDGIEQGIGALRRGEVLGLFPEGTRGSGLTLGRFKRGVLLILGKLAGEGREVTVLPVGIRGTAKALPKGAWFPRPVRIEVHYGRPLTAQEVLRDRDLQSLRRSVSILAEMIPGAEGGAVPGQDKPAGEESSSAARSAGSDPGDSLSSHLR